MKFRHALYPVMGLITIASCTYADTSKNILRWGTIPHVNQESSAKVGDILFSEFHYTTDIEFARTLESVEKTIGFSGNEVTFKIKKGTVFAATQPDEYGRIFYCTSEPVAFYTKDQSTRGVCSTPDKKNATLDIHQTVNYYKAAPTLKAEFYEAAPVTRGYRHDFVLQRIESGHLILAHKYYKDNLNIPASTKTIDVLVTSLPMKVRVADFDAELLSIHHGQVEYKISSRTENSHFPP